MKLLKLMEEVTLRMRNVNNYCLSEKRLNP
jgi:hypothetical protein